MTKGVVVAKDRADGTKHRELWRRLTLVRSDGQVYLNRWGIGHDRVGGVMLHRMDAPDPGVDLHDHPWWFVSIVLVGSYAEERIATRDAVKWAQSAEFLEAKAAERRPPWHAHYQRGIGVVRGRFSIKVMRLDECHTITELPDGRCWTLVVKGPRRREWGFYLPTGFMSEDEYDRTVRAERRTLLEQGAEVSG